MSDKTLTFTVEQLADALNNVRCMYDLSPELIAEDVFAQQPAPAVPDGWRPIETAPKDGTEIILRKGDRVTSGAWSEWSETYPEFHGTTGAWLGNVECESGAVWASWDGGFAEGDEPEYWMPLPSADQPAPVAPDGWKLVPVEPTEEMLSAMTAYDGNYYTHPFDQDDFAKDYAALLAAAPTAAEQPCQHRWVRDEEAIQHQCCQKCGAVISAAEQPDTVNVPRATAIALLDEGSRQETWVAQDELRALLAGGGA